MPVPFVLLFGFALGVLLAVLGRSDIARLGGSPWRSRALLVASLYGALVLAPITAFFLIGYADWAYVYLVDPSRIPSAIDLALVAITAVSVPGAVVIATPWVVDRREMRVMALAGIPTGLFLLGGILGFRRLGASATFERYAHRVGVLPLWATGLGRSVAFMGLLLLLGAALSVLMVRPGRALLRWR